MRRGRGWGAWLVGLALAAVWPGWAAGAEAVPGIVISPAFQSVTVPAQGEGGQYVFKVSNHNPVDQTFRLSAVDFGSLDEEGGVAFLGAPTSELEHMYGLAAWMVLEQGTVAVPAGQTVAVKVTIDNRPTLAPGGHYGAVLATAVDAAGQPLGGSVGVKQVVSGLVLAIKQGGERRVLDLASMTHDGSWWHLPGRVEQRFHSTGNVHVVPRGVVAVLDPTGQMVERAAINEASGVVLPDSFRRFSTSLMTVGKAWLPGRYALRVTYRYDGTDTTRQLDQSVWYVGALVVWLVAGLALAAVAGLVWWLWRRLRG